MELLTQGNFWTMLVIAYLGTLIHFFKKKIRGESWQDITTYFSDNLKSTIIAVVVTLIATIAYYTKAATGTDMDYITVFLIGFTIDSTLNNWTNGAKE